MAVGAILTAPCTALLVHTTLVAATRVPHSEQDLNLKTSYKLGQSLLLHALQYPVAWTFASIAIQQTFIWLP